MVTGGEVLAIVPARGGSKSIPRKNVRPLGGAPLIAWSIEAGLAARMVSRVVVSTDDEEIADVARAAGAEVPFLRPRQLAGDATPDLPVFQHALECLSQQEGYVPELVVHLRPTSPLRPPDCVDRAIERLRADATADSIRGVVASAQNPYKMWRVLADGTMGPLLTDAGPEPYNQPRQSLPPTYWQTGHIDVTRVRTIGDKGSMTGSRILPFVVDAAYACDVDTEADWLRLERTLEHFDFPIVRPGGSGAALPEVVKMVVFDFDGVMTDNRVWTSGDGGEWVACDRGDGLGLDQLRALVPDLLVISTETHPVVGARCRKLRVSVAQGIRRKAEYLAEVISSRGIDARDVIYVGNDVNDLACMRLVGCPVAVADAHVDVIAHARVVLSRRGGHGAVRELCDRLARHLAPDNATRRRDRS